MATSWEIATHSVDRMFSPVILVISRLGFEGWIWVLIASVHGLCIPFTLDLFSGQILDIQILFFDLQ